VRWARARSRIATSSWAAVSSAGAPLAAVEVAAAVPAAAAGAAAGAVRAVRAAPRASVSDMLSENASFSAAETWSAWPPKATKPGSSETEPSHEIR